MELVSNFFDKPEYAEPFYSLQKDVFSRIDLKWAHKRGYLRDTTPFGLFDGGRALSIATATRSDISIKGKVLNAVQLGTVATDTNHLMRGYSARVMRAILKQFPDRTIFLFANDDVVDFYPRFGFQPMKESVYTRVLPRGGKHRFIKLDLAQTGNLALVRRLLEKRCILSNHFCITDYARLAEWYCRVFYADLLWVDECRETLLVAKENEGQLSIYDLVSGDPDPDFFDSLAWPTCEKAVCYFVPDRFNGPFFREPDPTADLHLFALGDFPTDERNIVPILAHT